LIAKKISAKRKEDLRKNLYPATRRRTAAMAKEFRPLGK